MTLTKNRIRAITWGVVALYAAMLVWWFAGNPYASLSLQLPGNDGRPDSIARSADEVRIGEFFMQYEEPSSVINTSTEQWNRFRGPDLNNRVETPLVKEPPSPFTTLWKVTTGEGHAAPAIFGGRVYLLDYDEALRADALRCFSLETGKELWRRWYRVAIKRNHGFSRTIPFVNEKFVISLGPKGHVMCCDPITGEMKWELDIEKTYKTEVPFWYTGQCPIVENDVLIIATGGDALLAGIDCATGEEVWRTPNPNGYKMSHSSLIPMVLGGQRTFVYMAIGGIIGVAAEGADLGKLLWHTAEFQPNVIAPSPLQLSSSRVFLTAGYGSGGALMEVSRNGNSFSAKILQKHKPREGACSEQQTPVLVNNMVITVMPKDGGGLRDRLVCYTPDNLLQPVWTSAPDEKFGLGPFMIINNRLYVLKDDGELYIYQVGNRELSLLRKERILEGIDAWGPMAYADGKLLIRDAHNMLCLKLN